MRARSRAPIPGRKANRPTRPKCDTSRVAPRQDILRYCLGTKGGEVSGDKAHGLQWWREHGPWAARRFAACIYARPLGYLPQCWGGAAQSLRMPAPPLFENSKETAHVQQKRKLLPPDDESTPNAAPEMDLGDTEQNPATMSLNAEISPPGRDLFGCRPEPHRKNEASMGSPPASRGKWNKGSKISPPTYLISKIRDQLQICELGVAFPLTLAALLFTLAQTMVEPMKTRK